jgi:peptidoglycan/xylan/chitin deacetylase (PgdA/CDA1 family)
MENPPAHFPAWPGDADAAVALTFDVDGEAPWLSEGPEYSRRLTTLSQGRFGPVRGLGRILGLLAELEVTATFYVPGHTADQHPGAVEPSSRVATRSATTGTCIAAPTASTPGRSAPSSSRG